VRSKYFPFFLFSIYSFIFSTDWWENKVMHPWYLPSLLKILTKIPHEDWETIAGHTNINESSHPETNRHTGIGLTLLEAITKWVIISYIAIYFTENFPYDSPEPVTWTSVRHEGWLQKNKLASRFDHTTTPNTVS